MNITVFAYIYVPLWNICTVFSVNLRVEPQKTEIWWIMMSFSCITSSPSPDNRPAWMRDWHISTTAADCGRWWRPISNGEEKSPKSDSGGAQEKGLRKCQHCFGRWTESRSDRWTREDWPAYIQLSARTHLAPAELPCQTGERTRGSLCTVTGVQLRPQLHAERL